MQLHHLVITYIFLKKFLCNIFCQKIPHTSYFYSNNSFVQNPQNLTVMKKNTNVDNFIYEIKAGFLNSIIVKEIFILKI